MSSKPWISALLSVLAVVAMSALLGSSAVTPAAGTNASPYSGCPSATALEGCECSDLSNGPTVTVSGTDGNIDSCMASLSEGGYTTLYRLNVEEYPALNLTEDVLQNVLFEFLNFEEVTVGIIHNNFLGISRQFTKILRFENSHLLRGFPKIDGDELQEISFDDVFMDSNSTLPKGAFSRTPALEELYIYSADVTRVLTVPRDAFFSLTKLRSVTLAHSLHLRWGALHFAAPGLEYLRLASNARSGYTIDVGPGFIAGVPAGVEVLMRGELIGGWHASRFLNILREGVSLSWWETHDCGCDMAWIRYSSFLQQVDIKCKSSGADYVYLHSFDLSDCSFYKHQSMQRTDL